MEKENRIARFLDVDIYPVTCQQLSKGRSNLDVLEAVIRGGARIIQLREKKFAARDFYRLALSFRTITERAGVLLMINDHVDIALAVGADGVHLGQDDLPVAAARKIAPELLVGASTHSLEEALQAQKDGADYINIGPIFPTGTKQGVDRFLGPEAISQISPEIEIPFTVMGGISENNIDQVLNRGARRIAMVTAVTQAVDIVTTVRSIREKIQNYQGAS